MLRFPQICLLFQSPEIRLEGYNLLYAPFVVDRPHLSLARLVQLIGNAKFNYAGNIQASACVVSERRLEDVAIEDLSKFMIHGHSVAARFAPRLHMIGYDKNVKAACYFVVCKEKA